MKYIVIPLISVFIYTQAFALTPEVHFWDLSTDSHIAYYYFKGQEPRKPHPIIYLHGGPGGFVEANDLAVYGKLAEDGYDVYLYDQIGGGKSARLKNIREYSVKRHLKDLESIIDLIGAPEVIFIGHSWGASLAPIYLAEHPDKVEKLIFSGPGGMIPKHKHDIFVPLPDSVKMKNRPTKKHLASEFLDPSSYKRYNKIKNYTAFGIKIAPDKEIDSLLDLLICNSSKLKAKDANLPFTAFIGGSGGYSHFVTSSKIDKGKDKRDILRKLDTPVMVLLGESDPITWGSIADYLKVFKNVKFIIIPDSGHSVFSYQPEMCLQITKEFLTSSNK